MLTRVPFDPSMRKQIVVTGDANNTTPYALPPGKRFVGTIQTIASSSATMSNGTTQVSYPASTIAQIDVTGPLTFNRISGTFYLVGTESDI